MERRQQATEIIFYARERLCTREINNTQQTHNAKKRMTEIIVVHYIL
jgi:hypothetical protein